MPRPAQIVSTLGLRPLATSVSLGSEQKRNGNYYYHISANIKPGQMASAMAKVRRGAPLNYRGHIYRWHLDGAHASGNRLSFHGHVTYQFTPHAGTKRRGASSSTTRRAASWGSGTKRRGTRRTTSTPTRRLRTRTQTPWRA